jgi:DNA-directed RNA polymerase alpha subunit
MTEASAPDTPPTLLWTDAFPWLVGVAGLDANKPDPRWAAPIADTPESDVPDVAMEVAKLAIQHRPNSHIGSVFPRLPAELALNNLDLPARQRNVLRRHQLNTAGDLSSVTVNQLLTSWSVGPRVLEGIFQALVEESLAATMSGATAD